MFLAPLGRQALSCRFFVGGALLLSRSLLRKMLFRLDCAHGQRGRNEEEIFSRFAAETVEGHAPTGGRPGPAATITPLDLLPDPRLSQLPPSATVIWIGMRSQLFAFSLKDYSNPISPVHLFCLPLYLSTYSLMPSNPKLFTATVISNLPSLCFLKTLLE